MKVSTVSTGLLLAGSALAAPTKRTYTDIDVTVLQFALTLEHLENVFYKQALQKFTANDFYQSGCPETYYKNLQYIAFDEQSHVQLLTSALQAAGVTPVAACTYNFPYTDARSFLTLSSVLEGVGTSAYLGAAPLVTSKDYLTVAGSILVTEALHTSYQRAAVFEVPFANPYGTPLGPNPVYTLAAAFIKSCPSTNPPLPFKAFPALTGPAAATTAGATVKFSTVGAIPAGSYLTFVSGLNITSVSAVAAGANAVTGTVPASSQGQTYVLLTNSNVQGKLNDTSILAGPAIVEVTPSPPVINFNQQK